MTTIRISLNGTDPHQLDQRNANLRRAIHALRSALDEAWPNGRDYDNVQPVLKQYDALVQALNVVDQHASDIRFAVCERIEQDKADRMFVTRNHTER